MLTRRKRWLNERQSEQASAGDVKGGKCNEEVEYNILKGNQNCIDEGESSY